MVWLGFINSDIASADFEINLDLLAGMFWDFIVTVSQQFYFYESLSEFREGHLKISLSKQIQYAVITAIQIQMPYLTSRIVPPSPIDYITVFIVSRIQACNS